MTERQTITLPFPPSVNSLYFNLKGGGRAKTGAYKSWIRAAGWTLQAQRPKAFTDRVKVEILMNPPRKNCGDADNRNKAVLDLLTRHQVIEDDDHEFVASVLCKWVTEGPEYTVEIEVV
jgi:Holliday junction resolvase RusA-like endonuclease